MHEMHEMHAMHAKMDLQLMVGLSREPRRRLQRLAHRDGGIGLASFQEFLSGIPFSWAHRSCMKA